MSPFAPHRSLMWLKAVNSFMEITESGMRVAVVLAVRKNYQTGRCDPGAGTIAKDCGLSIRAVRLGIDQLVRAGLLSKSPGKGGNSSNSTSYNFIEPVNEDSPEHSDSAVNPDSPVNVDSSTGEPTCTLPVNGSSPKLYKELDNEPWSPPDGINLQAWSEFEQHRHEIKKPLSDLSRKKAAQVLIGKPFNEQQQIVDLTIANRWTGLFPLKTNQHQLSTKAEPYPTRKKEALSDYL